MKLTIQNAIDARQAPEWGRYLQSIGWTVERIGSTQLFIKDLPFIKRSFIKVQHPVGPIPFEEIEKIVKKYNALSIVIEPHPYNFEKQAYLSNGYKKSTLHYAHTATIKIDLQKSEKELFASFSENARRNIKKSQKNNVQIKSVWFRDDKEKVYFKMFYSLLSNLGKMKKFYVPSYEEYLAKMTAFGKTSVMLFAYEENQKEPCAVIWLASYGKIITYMQTGITSRGYELLANYLLVWEGLKLSQKLDMQIFDFETLYDKRYPKENKNWIGYSEFKKRFHGTLIEYPHPWIKIYNPVFNIIYSLTSFLS